MQKKYQWLKKKKRALPGKALERKKLVNALDREFSLFIRARDGNKCVMCGSVENVQCGHLFSRVAYATRWLGTNAVAQCARCNMNHERNAWPMTKWFIDKYGQEHVELLQRLWNKPAQVSNGQMIMMLTELKDKLREAQNANIVAAEQAMVNQEVPNA